MCVCTPSRQMRLFETPRVSAHELRRSVTSMYEQRMAIASLAGVRADDVRLKAKADYERMMDRLDVLEAPTRSLVPVG